MAVTFNELLEGTNLSEEARESIQEAWESRLDEAREEMTAELREEFAQRYEHDKGLIVEAVDNFISTRVTKLKYLSWLRTRRPWLKKELNIARLLVNTLRYLTDL